MNQQSKFEDNLRFVSRHYKKDAFLPHLHFDGSDLSAIRRRLYRRWAVAAAAVLAAGASAMILFQLHNAFRPAPMVAPADTAPAIAPADSADIETRIEFTDTPLSDIVKETEKVYGVKLTNLPDQSQRLTVSYEGNAQDFVAVLNQLLNADIKIETDIKMEEGSEK